MVRCLIAQMALMSLLAVSAHTTNPFGSKAEAEAGNMSGGTALTPSHLSGLSSSGKL